MIATPVPSAPQDPLDLGQYAPASVMRDGAPRAAAVDGADEVVVVPPSLPLDATLRQITAHAAALCAPLPGCFVAGRTIQATLLSALIIPIPFLGERVKATELAIAVSRDGEARLLEPGVNVVETLNADVRRFAASDDEVAHGNLKIVRVRPGHVGLASRAGQPVLLEPGVHISNDPLWLWRRQVANDCPHASEGALHVCFVPAGSLAPVIVDGRGRLLPPGQHRIVARTGFEYLGTKPATDEHIRAGTLHRVQVPAGSVGLATEGGAARLIGAGEAVYVDCPSFRYLGCRSLAEPLIVHDSIKLVTVNEGFAGISYDEGRLVVLDPGRHALAKPSHHVGGLVSLGQHTLPIAEVTSMSSDNVGLVFDAAITVQVVDVRRAVTAFAGAGRGDRMGPSGSGGGGGGGYRSQGAGGGAGGGGGGFFSIEDLHVAIVDKAKLALSIIIGNNQFNDSFRATTATPTPVADAAAVSADDAALAKPPPPTNPAVADSCASGDPGSFKQHVHDLFMQAFAREMSDACGVRVIDMSVEDVRLTNKDLEAAMSSAAVAATEWQRAQIAARIRETEARARQSADVIEAEGRARATEILAGAEAARVATLDAAMAAACSTSQQRELVLAAGSMLENAGATVLLGASPADTASMLASSAGADAVRGQRKALSVAAQGAQAA